MNLLCRIVTLSLFVFFLSAYFNNQAQAQSRDLCQMYGNVYVEEERRNADFIVYVEESEGFADLLVFEEDNSLMADREGLWYFVKSRALANFTIYIEKDRSKTNFSIFYTDSPSFAGCR